MYDFEVKIKVPLVYELSFEQIARENDRDGGVYDRTITKTERFDDWEKLRSFAYGLKPKGVKILQVVEVRDVTKTLLDQMRKD